MAEELNRRNFIKAAALARLVLQHVVRDDLFGAVRDLLVPRRQAPSKRTRTP